MIGQYYLEVRTNQRLKVMEKYTEYCCLKVHIPLVMNVWLRRQRMSRIAQIAVDTSTLLVICHGR